MFIPTVSMKQNNTNHFFDLFSRLLKDRIIIVAGEIDKDLSTTVISQLLYLQAQDKDKPILMYINSPGGSVTDGLAIIDTMNILSCPVETYCIGCCASMAAIICTSGTKGKRFILQHGRMMIHPVQTGAAGDIHFVQRQFKQAKQLNDILANILVKQTNQQKNKVLKDIQNDYFMSAKESVQYGLVDKILIK